MRDALKRRDGGMERREKELWERLKDELVEKE